MRKRLRGGFCISHKTRWRPTSLREERKSLSKKEALISFILRQKKGRRSLKKIAHRLLTLTLTETSGVGVSMWERDSIIERVKSGALRRLSI